MSTGVAINQLTMRRLCYTKGLMRIGINHLNAGTEVDISQALLSFDNSLEMMLKIILDFKGIKPKGDIYVPRLIDEVVKVYPSTPEVDLKTLHSLRNSIQHVGFIPASSQVQANKILVESFFESVSVDIFGIPWEQVSLGIFINNPTVRDLYLKADEALHHHRLQDAAFNVIAAFEVAMTFEDDRLWSSGLKKIEDKLISVLIDELNILRFRLDPKRYMNYREVAANLLKHPGIKIGDFLDSKRALDAVIKSSKAKVEEAERKGKLEDWLSESMDFVIDSVLKWEATYRPSLLEAIRDKAPSALKSLLNHSENTAKNHESTH